MSSVTSGRRAVKAGAGAVDSLSAFPAMGPKESFNRAVVEAVEERLGPDLGRLAWLMAFDGRPSVNEGPDGRWVTGFRRASWFAEKLSVSVFTVRRWWRKLKAAGFLEQWRVTRGLAYRVRLAWALVAPSQPSLFSASAPSGAPAALGARSLDTQTRAGSQMNPQTPGVPAGADAGAASVAGPARETTWARVRRLSAWADRVGALPDSPAMRASVLSQWRVGGWVADQIANARGCSCRVLADVAKEVLVSPDRPRSVQGLLVYRLRDRLGLPTRPSLGQKGEAVLAWTRRKAAAAIREARASGEAWRARDIRGAAYGTMAESEGSVRHG